MNRKASEQFGISKWMLSYSFNLARWDTTDKGFKEVEKKVNVVCDLGVGGERGRVLRGGIATAVTATEYKDPMKVLKKYEKNYSPRRNRKYG